MQLTATRIALRKRLIEDPTLEEAFAWLELESELVGRDYPKLFIKLLECWAGKILAAGICPEEGFVNKMKTSLREIKAFRPLPVAEKKEADEEEAA